MDVSPSKLRLKQLSDKLSTLQLGLDEEKQVLLFYFYVIKNRQGKMLLK
jgi:hypothetical protein